MYYLRWFKFTYSIHKKYIKKNENLSIKYDYDKKHYFPDDNNNGAVWLFLDSNNIMSNKIIDYSIKVKYQ